MTKDLNKINFILEKAGGDSLAHFLSMLSRAGQIKRIDVRWSYLTVELEYPKESRSIEWQYFTDSKIDNKEAKLPQQSEKTIIAIFNLLGGAND